VKPRNFFAELKRRNPRFQALLMIPLITPEKDVA